MRYVYCNSFDMSEEKKIHRYVVYMRMCGIVLHKPPGKKNLGG